MVLFNFLAWLIISKHRFYKLVLSGMVHFHIHLLQVLKRVKLDCHPLCLLI